MKTATRIMDRLEAGRWGRVAKLWKPREETIAQNRRRFHRFPCTLPVELHIDIPGQLAVISAVAKNLSRGGMLIACPTLPPLMSTCHVAFRIPEWVPFSAGRHPQIFAKAHVQHRDKAGMNFGLAFSALI